MRASELSDKLRQVMLDTGRGSRPVVFLDDFGDIYNIDDVVFRIKNNVIFLRGTLMDFGRIG